MMPRTRSDVRLSNRCRSIVYLDFEGFLDEESKA